MNKWLKSIVILLQVVGGLLGLYLIGQVILTEQLTQLSVLVHVGFFFIFSFGIVAGLALIKKPVLGLFMSVIFQAIQIPIISTSVISYHMFCGANFSVHWHETGFGTNFFLGSRYYFYLNSGMPWLYGINIIALILFAMLIREFLYQVMVAKSYRPRQRRVYTKQQFEQMQDRQTDCGPIRHSTTEHS